jgi:hypothetical protein
MFFGSTISMNSGGAEASLADLVFGVSLSPSSFEAHERDVAVHVPKLPESQIRDAVIYNLTNSEVHFMTHIKGLLN